MDFTQIKLMKMMEAKMAYHSERQDVLSQNVANADTPGYRARDIAEPDFEGALKLSTPRLQMKRTSEEHSIGMHYKQPTFQSDQTKKFVELKPVKNTINLEEESMKMSHNAFDFQTTTSLYQKTAGLFRTAIGSTQ